MFVGDATVSILGVADVNPWAPGIEFARRFNIPVTTDLREFVTDPRTDLIIDVTGSPEVHETILRSKPPGAEVMGGLSARFVWDLRAERKRTEELEDRYSLVVRELQAQEGDFIIGQNPKMREIAELVARVAPAPTTVLVRGESGTGKELVARAIHKYSPLRDKPLLTVNCTALTPSLMESELFGHRRGAFTGAIADKVGLFEKADGGTIFLDEIGDMPLEMQGKLLRVLQAGEIKPVGDVATRRVRVRVIAATNRDLETAMQRTEFRGTSSIGSMRSRSPFLGFANGWRTCRSWPITSFAKRKRRSTRRWSGSRLTPWTSSSDIPGQGTFASSRTSSSERLFSPVTGRSSPSIYPFTCRNPAASRVPPTIACLRGRNGSSVNSSVKLSCASFGRVAATFRQRPRKLELRGGTFTGSCSSTAYPLKNFDLRQLSLRSETIRSHWLLERNSMIL